MFFSRFAIGCLCVLSLAETAVNAQMDDSKPSRNLRSNNQNNGNGNGNASGSGNPNPNRFFVHGTLGESSKESEVSRECTQSGGQVKMSVGKGKGKKLVVELPENAQANGFKKRMAAKGYRLETDYPRYADKNFSMAEEIKRARQLQQATPYGISKVFGGNIPTSFPNTVTHPICIIDSGYNIAHPDLPNDATNADPNQKSTDTNPYDTDGCDHGTHVAGTIAAVDNTEGVIGVWPGAPDIKVVKVFGTAGSTSCGWSYTSNLIQASQYCVDSQAKIITMSLGGSYYSSAEEQAYQSFFENDGVLSIAAAGNGGSSSYSYPASYPYVMSVGATDSNDAIASFSQFNDAVDISAPGVGITSTVGTSGYASYSGTSMATPHVSGVALLLWNKYPQCTASNIRNVLELTAQDLGTPGRDNYYGHGLVRFDLADQFLAENGCVDPPTEPPTPCTGATVEISITLDNYPGETSWVIKDSTGTTVASNGGYSGLSGQTVIEEVCAPTNLGDLTFTISDSYGDGICCAYGQGSYTVKVNGIVAGSGGEFGSSEDVVLSFDSITPAPTPGPTPAPTPVPTPAPTTGNTEEVTLSEGKVLYVNMDGQTQQLVVKVIDGRFNVEFAN